MPPPDEDARAGGASAKFGRFPQPRIAGAVALSLRLCRIQRRIVGRRSKVDFMPRGERICCKFSVDLAMIVPPLNQTLWMLLVASLTALAGLGGLHLAHLIHHFLTTFLFISFFLLYIFFLFLLLHILFQHHLI